MKKHPLLSIIVPVYNTEKYLQDCLNSLLEQNVDDYEIILINDGSTDKSELIIGEYTDKFSNIVCIKQKNMGQAAARNKGIEIARGEYIYFMDSDDILANGALSLLINYTVTNNLDVIFFDGESFVDGEIEKNKENKFLFNYIRGKSYGLYNNGENIFADFIYDKTYTVSPCLFLIKNELIRSKKLAFKEGIIQEDELFAVQLFLAAGKVMHVNEQLFLRRIRSGSTMTSSNNLKKIDGYYTVLEDLNTLYYKHSFINKRTKEAYKKNMLNIYANIIHLLSACDNQEMKSIYLNKSKIIAKNHIFFGIRGILLTFSYPLSKQIINFKKKIKIKKGKVKCN